MRTVIKTLKTYQNLNYHTENNNYNNNCNIHVIKNDK